MELHPEGRMAFLRKEQKQRGWPGGGAVKFTCSTSAAPGFAGLDPGHGHMHCLSSHAVASVLHTEWRKMGTDVSSGPVFLSQKRRIGSRCQLRDNLPQKKKKEDKLHPNGDGLSTKEERHHTGKLRLLSPRLYLGSRLGAAENQHASLPCPESY